MSAAPALRPPLDPTFRPPIQAHRAYRAAAVSSPEGGPLIVGSAAGIYVDNRVKVASLFRAVPDDLEVMAYHGIGTCLDDPDRWFGGVTCTDGAGSPRTGPYAGCSDDEMKQVRRGEQDRAAALVRGNPEAVLGLATGNSPVGFYAELVRMHRDEGLDFSRVTTCNLDEAAAAKLERIDYYNAVYRGKPDWQQ